MQWFRSIVATQRIRCARLSMQYATELLQLHVSIMWLYVYAIISPAISLFLSVVLGSIGQHPQIGLHERVHY